MRAAVPFLISSLVLASFTFDVSHMINQNFVAASSNKQDVVSFRKKPQRNQPEDSVPNRGSGRRDIMKSQFSSYFNV